MFVKCRQIESLWSWAFDFDFVVIREEKINSYRWQVWLLSTARGWAPGGFCSCATLLCEFHGGTQPMDPSGSRRCWRHRSWWFPLKERTCAAVANGVRRKPLWWIRKDFKGGVAAFFTEIRFIPRRLGGVLKTTLCRVLSSIDQASLKKGMMMLTFGNAAVSYLWMNSTPAKKHAHMQWSSMHGWIFWSQQKDSEPLTGSFVFHLLKAFEIYLEHTGENQSNPARGFCRLKTCRCAWCFTRDMRNHPFWRRFWTVKCVRPTKARGRSRLQGPKDRSDSNLEEKKGKGEAHVPSTKMEGKEREGMMFKSNVLKFRPLFSSLGPWQL